MKVQGFMKIISVHGSENRSKMLEELDLHITNRCNMRCIHCCYSSGELSMDEMSLDDIEQLILDAKSLGAKHLDIFGGEPTLREDLIDVVKLASSLELKVELLTNGFLVNEGRLDHLLNAGLDSVGVSLDGTKPEIYSKIRRVNCVDKVINFIQRCVDRNIYTEVNTVLFNSNLNNIIDIINLSNRIGVQEQRIYYFTPVGRGKNHVEEWVDPLKWLSFVRENLVDLDLNLKLYIETPFIERNKVGDMQVGCRALKKGNYIQVLSNGDIFPCAILASFYRPLENVRKQRLIDLWNSDEIWNYNLKEDECVGYVKLLQNPSYMSLIKDKGYVSLCPCVKFPISVFK